MSDKKKEEAQESINVEPIYLNIDHLKKGQYELKILLKNKVVKSVRITK